MSMGLKRGGGSREELAEKARARREAARKKTEMDEKLGGQEGAAAGKLTGGIIGKILDPLVKAFVPGAAGLPIEEGLEQISELAGREIGKEAGASDDTGETAKALKTAAGVTDIAAKFVPDITPPAEGFTELEAEDFEGTLLGGEKLAYTPPLENPEDLPSLGRPTVLGASPTRKTTVSPKAFPGIFGSVLKLGGK